MTAIGSGYYRGLAVKSDGTVWSWGYNNYGQLGDGVILDTAVPIAVLMMSPGEVLFMIEFAITAGGIYDLNVVGKDMMTLYGTSYIFGYDPDVMQLQDLCAITWERELAVGEISGTGVTVTGFLPGEMTFTVDKNIPDGMIWTGILNTLRLLAVESGTANVSMAIG